MSPIFFFSCVIVFALFAHQSASDECDTKCEDKPVFTPSKLVVKYGDALSTTCTVCERACIGAQFNVEKAVGQSFKNETAATVVWTVDKVTEWDTSALCYYNDQHQSDHQCCTDLHATVYQPPSQVSISVVDHSGPMIEGQQYTLQCAVQQAAPVQKLRVVFYKEQTELLSKQPEGSVGPKNPQDKNFTLDFTPSREDNGVAFWCEVSLDLDIPEGRPVVTSTNMTAQVHCQPKVNSSLSKVISISVGEPLHMSCRAEGNPAPIYQWAHRSHQLPAYDSADFIIKSTSSSDGGEYTCLASNSMGNVTLTFQVHVKTNYIPYIIGAICSFLLLLLIILWIVYRKRRMGKYDFIPLSRSKRVSQQQSSA